MIRLNRFSISSSDAATQRHHPGLPAVPIDIALGLTRLFGTSHLLGADQQDRFDGGLARQVDQLIDGLLGVADHVEKRQQELAVPAQEFGDLSTVGLAGDLIQFLHGYSFRKR
jgi:hypothetical protein